MGRRRKAQPAKPSQVHGSDCVCRGKGILPGADFTHTNGVTYTKVGVRCPGVKAWTEAPLAAPPAELDQKGKAAGERE